MMGGMGSNNFGSFGAADGGGAGMSQGMGGSPTKTSYDEITVTPLTIRQFQTAVVVDVDAKVLVDDAEVKDLTLVGRVVSAEPSDSSLAVVIEDGTGRMSTKYWYPHAGDGSTDGAKKAEMDAAVVPCSFVKVTASAKVMSGGRALLNNLHLRPLTDPNELTLHFIEAIYAHVDRVRRVPYSKGGSNPEGAAGGTAGGATGFGLAGVPSMGAPAGAAGGGFGGGFGGGMDTKPTFGSGVAPGLGAPLGGAGGPSTLDASAISAQVRAILDVCKDDAGMAIVDVAAQLAGKGISEAQVRSAVEDLSMAGAVYSTTDDEHVKSTAADE